MSQVDKYTQKFSTGTGTGTGTTMQHCTVIEKYGVPVASINLCDITKSQDKKRRQNKIL